MKIIKRYYSEGRLVEDENGPLVMFEDFQALEAESQQGTNERNQYEDELARKVESEE